MHPRITELVDYAEAQRAALLAAVALIPERLRDRRPKADAWSAAEVLEHLHRVERGIVRLLVQGLQRAKADRIGPELESGSLLGALDQFDLPRRGRRVSAPGPVQPRGELTPMQALTALAESRRAFRAALEAVNGLALAEITYPHPLLGALNLYQWALFVGQHEARHALQIRELAAQLVDSRSDTC